MANTGGYREAYDRSITDPEGFWADQASLVTWIKKPQKVLDDSASRSTAGSPTPP